MRVLVVDQDSASNEAIARSLRDLYTVDAVTNKGDCLDLLRSNTFEVIVATERLEDGSGLELLGTIAKKWPSVLRIFAADRHRLQLLKGRLGPFDLFQTLTYPIDPNRLIATLNLADAAQEAHADTSNIQHVVLSGESPEEEPPDVEQAPEESGEFPAPQPMPRAASMDRSQAAPKVTRTAVRGGPSHRVRSIPPGHRARGNGAAGPPITRIGAGASAARTQATSPSLNPEGGRPLRHGRSRSATNRAPPVRFPPLERTPPLEPPQGSLAGRHGASQADSFAEAAAMARSARSNFESPPEQFDAKRLALMAGGGATILVAVVVIGFKLFGSKSEAPLPAAPAVVHAPQYSQEVVDLVAQTESALEADDFKSVRANVDKLRQLAPSHPRLAFFDGLLVQRADAAKGSGSAGTGHGASKRGGQSPRRSESNAAPDENATIASGRSPSPPAANSTTSPSPNLASHASAAAPSLADTRPVSNSGATSMASPRPAAGTDSGSTVATGGESPTSPGFAPETPPGLTRSSTTSAATATAHDAVQSASVSTTAVPAGEAPVTAPPPSADTASPAPTHVASTSTIRRPSPTPDSVAGEPPPVIREARLIRSVTPDYPSAAKHDGLEGSVDLELTISSRGVVEGVTVVHATPQDMFEKAAVAAVRKWKYDPRFVDGLPSEAHVKVHLEFAPGK